MQIRKLLIVVAIVLGLSTAALPARANTIEIAPAGNNITMSGGIQVVFNGLLITCPFTFWGTLPSDITKVPGEPVGHYWSLPGVTCNNGMPMTFLANWNYSYDGFTGVLPNIGLILLEYTNIGFQLHAPPPINTCLYGGSFNGYLSVGGGTPPGNGPLALRGGGLFCQPSIRFVIAGTVSPGQLIRLV